jgi:hypothetical protein
MNKAQRYILGLLREYGALRKSQLETMARCEVYPYLKNLDGYLKQLAQEKQVTIKPYGAADFYIALPGITPDSDVANAFDLVVAFCDKISWHKKATPPVALTFFFEDGATRGEAWVLTVHKGAERAVTAFLNAQPEGGCEMAFLLLDTKTQMKMLPIASPHTFVRKSGGEVKFFKSA